MLPAGARPGSAPPDRSDGSCGWLVTFNVVCLAWVFFRAPTFAVAFDIIHQIAHRLGHAGRSW